MGWYLILATIPVGVLGLVFKRQITTGARNLWLIASALIVLALVLGVAERVGSRNRTEEDITTRDALVVGAAQSLALIPGVSRSGSTITAGPVPRPGPGNGGPVLVPAVGAGGGGLQAFEAQGHRPAAALPEWASPWSATVISFAVGLASIAWLLRYVSRHSTSVFIGYRVALGLLLFAPAGRRRRSRRPDGVAPCPLSCCCGTA